MARTGRPPRAHPPLKTEINWSLSPMVKELMAEADARGVTLQRHIHDVLQERHNRRHGRPTSANTLWTPVGEGYQPAEASEQSSPSAASQSADAWLSMLSEL